MSCGKSVSPGTRPPWFVSDGPVRFSPMTVPRRAIWVNIYCLREKKCFEKINFQYISHTRTATKLACRVPRSFAGVFHFIYRKGHSVNRNDFTRRDFIKSTALLTTTALLPSCSAKAKMTAIDQVTLGKTGIKLSRLGIGTGTYNGEPQRGLGTDGFNRLIRYAYDQGITYIDTAENYKTHPYVASAIKGLPREKLFIQSKMPRIPENPLETIDRYRQELGVDYIDSLLVHVATRADWDVERASVLEAMDEAKSRGWIHSHGVSAHSLAALERAAALDWVDVNLVQMNPQGANLNRPAGSTEPIDPAYIDPTVAQLKIAKANNHGIIGMKIMGEGKFVTREDRVKSITFAMQSGLPDAVVIGMVSTSEVDEAIEMINNALATV